MKTCYYAHSTALYNTKQESRDLELLDNLGFTVINPSDDIHQTNYLKEGGMEYFKHIVESCDILIFRSHVDLNIGAGVAAEIGWAQNAKLPIIELPSVMNSRMLDVNLTKEYLREVGQR